MADWSVGSASEGRGLMENIVIVGAGECGARAAIALRELGYSGRLTLIGEEDDAPYERPPLSKEVLASANDEVDTPTICSVDHLADLQISFMASSRVASLDRRDSSVTLDDNSTVTYDRLLLATGARARQLSLPGGENALLLRTRAQSFHIRSLLSPGTTVGVIGGGFIGLEVAASARSRGCEVAIYEIAPQVLGRLVPDIIATAVADRHADAGVEISCSTAIDAIDERNDGFSIVCADGKSRLFDVVIAGIGADPNTELAASAGLEVENGIRVDHRLRTSDPNIWAAGDCCSFPHPLYPNELLRLEAWRNAQDQAEHAARAMLGAEAPYSAVPWFWTDQYELGLQMSGLPNRAAVEVTRNGTDNTRLCFGLSRDGRLIATSGLGRGTSVAKDISIAERLIAAGAQVSPSSLADPMTELKSLLTGMRLSG